MRFLFCLMLWLLPSVALAAAPVKIVASFSILADIAAKIGAEHGQVSSLVGVDQSPHHFSPNPADVKMLTNADLLVVNGLGYDLWAEKIAKAADFKGKVVVASKDSVVLVNSKDTGHHHDHGTTDPHLWLNPENGVRYARNVAEALAEIDPEHKAGYKKNLQNYKQQLEALNAEAKQRFSRILREKRVIIIPHQALRYVQGTWQVAVLALGGLSDESQTSAKDFAGMVALAKEKQAQAIFLEAGANPKMMQQLSHETGIPISGALYFDSLTGPSGEAPSYLQMLRHNMETVLKALE